MELFNSRAKMQQLSHLNLEEVCLDRETRINHIIHYINNTLDLNQILQFILDEIGDFLQIDYLRFYPSHIESNLSFSAKNIIVNALSNVIVKELISSQDYSYFTDYLQPMIIDVVNGTKIYKNQNRCNHNFNWQCNFITEKQQQYLLRLRAKTIIIFPIFVSGKLWGLLIGINQEPKFILSSQINFVQLVLNYLSLAINNLQFLEKEQINNHNDQQINNFLNLLFSLKELKGNSQQIINHLVSICQADFGKLFLTETENHDHKSLSEIAQNWLIDLPLNISYSHWSNLLKSAIKINCEPKEHNLFDLSIFGKNTQGMIPHFYLLQAGFNSPKLQGNFKQKELLLPKQNIDQLFIIFPLQAPQGCVGYLCFLYQNNPNFILNFNWLNQGHYAWGINPDFSSILVKENVKIIQRLSSYLYLYVRHLNTKIKLQQKTNYDALTQLLSRQQFEKKLSMVLLSNQKQQLANININIHHHNMVAVLLLDIDNFKIINNSLGHQIGDELLKLVAHRLKENTDQKYNLARWGGDEFVWFLPNIDNADIIKEVSDRILNCFVESFIVDQQELYLKASLGIALAPFDGEDVNSLLKHAEAAMYQSKSKGKNQYFFYHANIGKNIKERLMLENGLYQALKNHELQLRYQPQIDLKTGHIIGLESLIRWEHPQLGLLSPAKFIPIAEETGLIIPMGEWIVRTVCEQIYQWQQQNIPLLRVAINLSPLQFRQRHLVTMISNIIEQTQINNKYLEIEITETTLLEDLNFAVATLRALKGMNIHVSLDDFGTGYSSLSMLKELPLNTLKIDQSFMKDVMNDPNAVSIIKAVISLGQGLNLKVIAEGVETIEQLEFLNEVGCDIIQGFFFSPPLTSNQIPQCLKNSPYNIKKLLLEYEKSLMMKN